MQQLELSRSQVLKLLDTHAVRLDERPVTLKDKGRLLIQGQTLIVDAFARAEDQLITPQPDLPVPILAQGEGWLIVNKPAGMPVHPLLAGETNTVLNAIAATHPQIQGVGESGLRSGVVHRLDLETSGTLLLATEQQQWQKLRDAFTAHNTRKIYHALVRGQLTGARQEVMHLIIAQHSNPAKVRVLDAPTSRSNKTTPPRDLPRDARRCDLRWKSLETLGNATLLEIELGSGFLHQIRVMLAHLGHPVLGDALYGDPAQDPLPLPRPMLHAAELHVLDCRATALPPEDFAQAMLQLRGTRP